MKALVANGSGGATVRDVEDLPVRDTFVKIKVHAIALNPTDYKHVFHFTKGGEIVGCDVAGEIVDVGSKVQSKVTKGDRIAGLVHGCNTYSTRDGGFAEYAEIKDGIFVSLPKDWEYTTGATLGAGVTTAGQGLFQALQLPLPSEPTTDRAPILIYGGSTATGCLAIQYAHLAGLKVITLASPGQFKRLKSLGADVCYDYHTEDGAGIRRDFPKLRYAFDIITNEDSMKIVANALAAGPVDGHPPQATLLLPGKTFPRDDVEVKLTSGYSVMGETSIKYGNVVAGEPADYEFGKTFWALTEKLIHEGKLRAHETEVRHGGLDDVTKGLKELEDHEVKGVKLVYTI